MHMTCIIATRIPISAVVVILESITLTLETHPLPLGLSQQFCTTKIPGSMVANLTALLSTLITANHILSYHDALDPFGHVNVRNPVTNTTFFIALQLGPAVVSGPGDIGEYLIEDGEPVNGTVGGYAERYIHSEVKMLGCV
jgi:hypothetical protein